MEADTKSATRLNTKITAQYRPELKKYYYNQERYSTYLGQLRIRNPQLQKKHAGSD